MIIGFETQDTIKGQITVRINTDKLLTDSVFRKLMKSRPISGTRIR